MPTPIRQGGFDSPRALTELLDAFAPLVALIPGTRFAIYHDAIRSHVATGNRFADLDDDRRAVLRHAVAESMEMLDIFDALTAPPRIANCESEMRHLLDGHVTPRSARHFIELAGSVAQAEEIGEETSLIELVRTPIENLRVGDEAAPEVQDHEEAPRNAAFELWLARPFRRAGLTPEKAEPDWVLPTTVGRIGVAAKRVQSIERLATRLTDGADQIMRQVNEGGATAGIVAVDLTLAYDLHRKHWVIRAGTESKELDAALVGAMRYQRTRVLRALRGRGTCQRE